MKKLQYKKSIKKNELLVSTKLTEPEILVKLLSIFGHDTSQLVSEWKEDYVDEDTGEVLSFPRKEFYIKELPKLILVNFSLYKQFSQYNNKSWIEIDGKFINFGWRVHEGDVNIDVRNKYLLSIDVETKSGHKVYKIPATGLYIHKNIVIKLILEAFIEFNTDCKIFDAPWQGENNKIS